MPQHSSSLSNERNRLLAGCQAVCTITKPIVGGEEEPLPQPGDYSVILDSKDEAICIIQTTKTTVVPFNEVSEEHAYKEGEGDRSLAYWRAVHEEFFTKEFEETKTEFNGQTRILCEEFQVVYDCTTTYQKISSPLAKNE